MWHHFCPCEHAVIGVANGEPCNWCDTPEPDTDMDASRAAKEAIARASGERGKPNEGVSDGR